MMLRSFAGGLGQLGFTALVVASSAPWLRCDALREGWAEASKTMNSALLVVCILFNNVTTWRLHKRSYDTPEAGFFWVWLVMG